MRLYGTATLSLSQDTEHVPDVVRKGKYPFSQPLICSDMPYHLPFSLSSNCSILFRKYSTSVITDMFLFPSGFRTILDQKYLFVIYVKTPFLLF